MLTADIIVGSHIVTEVDDDENVVHLALEVVTPTTSEPLDYTTTLN